LVEGFTGGPGLLRAVQHRDRADRRRERRDERRGVERPEQAHVHDADLLAAGCEGVHGLAHDAVAGAHQHDDAFGVGGAVVVEQVVRAARELGEPVHGPLDDLGHDLMERVRGLAGLEEHVWVLGAAAQHGVVGGQGALAVGAHEVVVHQLAEHFVGQVPDHVHLVGGPEPVEEVQERHPGLERGRVGHGRQVLGRLHVGGGQHRPARLAHSHHVALVAEDRQRVRGERPSGHVDHRG